MTDSSSERPHDSTSGGERPRESIRELIHPTENVGPDDAEREVQQQAIDEAAAEAERIKAEPGHHGRDHL